MTTTPTNNEEFLQAVFAGLSEPHRPFVAGVAGKPKERKAWGGDPWQLGKTSTENPSHNWYYTLAAYAPEDGYHRQEKHCAGIFGVMLDDVGTKALPLERLEACPPSIVIETSPGNYQAWVKLSDKPLSADVRRIAAQGLAKQYGGDPNSADSRHYGRLAGFTNQKPQYARDGRQPYVLAHDCPGKAARAAPAYLERIEQHLDRAAAQQEREKRLEALETAKPGGYGSQYDPVKEYQRQAQRLMQRYGKEADFSRLDWMIATDMAKSGRFTAQDIEKGIRECSPHVESRKAGHVEDYARRTAANAWAAPEVQAHRQERERQAPRSRDRDGPGMSR